TPSVYADGVVSPTPAVTSTGAEGPRGSERVPEAGQLLADPPEPPRERGVARVGLRLLLLPVREVATAHPLELRRAGQVDRSVCALRRALHEDADHALEQVEERPAAPPGPPRHAAREAAPQLAREQDVPGLRLRVDLHRLVLALVLGFREVERAPAVRIRGH